MEFSPVAALLVVFHVGLACWTYRLAVRSIRAEGLAADEAFLLGLLIGAAFVAWPSIMYLLAVGAWALDRSDRAARRAR